MILLMKSITLDMVSLVQMPSMTRNQPLKRGMTITKWMIISIGALLLTSHTTIQYLCKQMKTCIMVQEMIIQLYPSKTTHSIVVPSVPIVLIVTQSLLKRQIVQIIHYVIIIRNKVSQVEEDVLHVTNGEINAIHALSVKDA